VEKAGGTPVWQQEDKGLGLGKKCKRKEEGRQLSGGFDLGANLSRRFQEK